MVSFSHDDERLGHRPRIAEPVHRSTRAPHPGWPTPLREQATGAAPASSIEARAEGENNATLSSQTSATLITWLLQVGVSVA